MRKPRLEINTVGGAPPESRCFFPHCAGDSLPHSGITLRIIFCLDKLLGKLVKVCLSAKLNPGHFLPSPRSTSPSTYYSVALAAASSLAILSLVTDQMGLQ